MSDFVARDILGQEFRVGDVVTYPCRQSSSLWITVAVVLGLPETSRDSLLVIKPRKGRTTRISNFRKVSILSTAQKEIAVENGVVIDWCDMKDVVELARTTFQKNLKT